MSDTIQNKVEIARDICRYAHAGQKDKAVNPYYHHPERVAENVTEPN